jgi:glycosyltransferase involved in cell wall biosynthesis
VCSGDKYLQKYGKASFGMKHVVVIGKYYPPEFGGVERYAYDVAHIAAKAHRVTVLVHNTGPKDSIERHGNITVIRCGTNKIIRAQPISLSMYGHMRSLQPDLVHFNAPNFWAAAMLLLTAYRGPIVVTHHADVFGRPILKRAVMPIYHRLLRQAACVVLNSLKTGYASSDIPVGAGPLLAIPQGVDASAYNVDGLDRNSLTAERRRLCGDAPVVGFIGRFVRYKGLSVLIDALARLDGVHAMLIGDGPLRHQTKEQAQIAGIADRVHFFGIVDEPTKIRSLAMMDMLLLPSVETTEAFGVVQIEAQLMSVPVIASRLPTGVTDITIDGDTGLLVPPGDAEALTRSISRLINDPALAARLGTAGRAHALENFTFEVFQRRIEELFEAVLSGCTVEGPLRPMRSAAILESYDNSGASVGRLPDMQPSELVDH